MRFFLLFFTFFSVCFSVGQSTSWVQSLNSNHGFSPNMGRYGSVMEEEVFFYTQTEGYTIFFSEDALIFGSRYLPTKEDLMEVEVNKDNGEESRVSKPWSFYKIEFQGNNKNLNFSPQELNKHTNHFQNPQNLSETIRAPSYKSLIYENIYDGIDLILEIPISGGLKYSFSVNAGADYHQIKMKYVNAIPKMEGEQLSIETNAGRFSDRAPTAEVNGETIDARFELNGNTVSFLVDDYDPSETLIIDPWIETGLDFAFYNACFEVEYDDNGEVTILGNYGEQISHYDNTGLLEWTWTEPGADPLMAPVISKLGDLKVDPVTGRIYYIGGFLGNQLYYLTADGIIIDIHSFDFASELQEQWRLYFNKRLNEIWVGGGNYMDAPDLERLNADMTSWEMFDTYAFDGELRLLDVALIEMNLEEDTIYFLSCVYEGIYHELDNKLTCVTRDDPLAIIWQTPTGHGFNEVANIEYYPETESGLNGNGFNGIVCGERYLYTYNGNMLQNYDKNTGTILGTTTIDQLEFTHAGIDLDPCGNIYIGTDDSIMIFDDALNHIGSILAPDTTYDLQIEGDKLYLGGNNFVAQLDLEVNLDPIAIASTDAVCGCFGSATVTVDPSDNTPCLGFEYTGVNWRPGGETEETIDSLCSGWYFVEVTYMNNAGELFIIIDSVEVNHSGEEITVDLNIVHEVCGGSCDGEVELTPATGAAPFEFDLDGTINASGIFDGLCAGTHTVSVTDDNGCNSEITFTIESATLLELALVTVNNPTCYGFSDGSIQVGTADDIGEVVYEWLPENDLDGPVFNTAPSGEYIVYATASNGCSDSLVIILTAPDSLYIAFDQTDVLCYGDSTGIVVIDSVYNAQGDLSNISYLWNPNTFGADGVGMDSSYNMPKGKYTLIVNDDNGCTQEQTFVIEEPDPITFVELGDYPALCRLYDFQNGGGVVYAAATGGTPEYVYEWLNMETGETSINTTWGGLNPGNYQITVIDENGCVLIEIIHLDSINPMAQFAVMSDQLNGNCEGTELVSADFINQSSGYTNDFDSGDDTTFYWNLDHPKTGWISSSDYNEIMHNNYMGEAIYEVCLIAKNKNGCADTACKDIIVHVQPEFIAPNIFSPDGDGKNDLFTFEFRSLGIETFECAIVNRWGIKVAQLNSITDSWDGNTFNGATCNDGIYFFEYRGMSTNNTVYRGHGNVQLVRD